jgi:hypothetical protein
MLGKLSEEHTLQNIKLEDAILKIKELEAGNAKLVNTLR